MFLSAKCASSAVNRRRGENDISDPLKVFVEGIIDFSTIASMHRDRYAENIIVMYDSGSYAKLNIDPPEVGYDLMQGDNNYLGRN
tara:strand:+ start:44780 stop:45034 length:255 start_codon:yes stop_codon:yes gene_type:complete